MRKQTPLLDKHFEWMKNGIIDGFGLCGTLEDLGSKYYDSLKIFEPTDEFNILKDQGLSITFWASGMDFCMVGVSYNYTELRQNIVLLICAMHDEL